MTTVTSGQAVSTAVQTMAVWKGRPVVYRMYDHDGRLVYIGASQNMPLRVALHRQETWWFGMVARTRMQVFPSMAAAFAAETAAIQDEQPAFNRKHTGRELYDFSHWSLDDHRLCREWQAVNGRRGYLPPWASQDWFRRRSAS